MTARDHHVPGQPPNWSRPSQAFRHMDGSLPRRHKTERRKLPQTFRKALRNYRRHVRPMAEEPRSLVDSWLFLICGLIAAGVLLWARSQGGL